MRRPLVSVIIPTYNRASLVVGAVESVLNQTWRDLELILVDDGSTDNTREVLNPYISRIHYLHQSNKGKSAALNLGLRAAHGEWIAVLDSDDSWTTQKLDRQFQALEKFKNGFCFTDIVTTGDPTIAGTAFERRRKQFDRPFGTITNAVDYVLTPPHAIYIQTALVRSDILTGAGGFDEDLYVEDTDAIFRIALKTDFTYVNEPLVCVDRTPKRSNSLVESYEEDPSRILKCQEIMYNKWLMLAGRLNERHRQIIRQRLSVVHNGWSNWHIARSDWAAARQSLRQASALNSDLKLRIKQILLNVWPEFIRAVVARRVLARWKQQRELFLGVTTSTK